MKRPFAIILGAVFCLAFAAPALAADPTRPFRSTSSSVDSMGDPATCPADAFGRYVSNGTSYSLHLGKATVVVTHCVWLDSPTTGHFGPGTVTFTAASGDTLILATSGTFEFVMTPAGPFSFVDMEWDISGGTGRFQGATGSGHAAPVSDLLAGTTTATVWGEIAY